MPGETHHGVHRVFPRRRFNALVGEQPLEITGTLVIKSKTNGSRNQSAQQAFANAFQQGQAQFGNQQQQFANQLELQQNALSPISAAAGALPLLAFAPQTSILGGFLGGAGGAAASAAAPAAAGALPTSTPFNFFSTPSGFR